MKKTFKKNHNKSRALQKKDQPIQKNLNHKKVRSHYFGRVAEFLAVAFLMLKGYKIIKKRYRSFLGEIDIIAKKANYLVAIEVKARRQIELLEEVLSNRQKQRIKKAMQLFLSSREASPFLNCGVRFDLLVITPRKFFKHLIGFWE